MSAVLENALAALKRGELIVLLDDVAAVKKAYLLGAGQSTTAEQISYMVNRGRGLVCAAISEQRIKELGLPPMVRRKTNPGVDFTVSVEARQGVTTGISAAD